MTRPVHVFLTICLLLANVDLVASKNDTTTKVRYKTPRSSLLYQVLPGIHPRTKVWVIGSVVFQDIGFRFVAYSEIPGWPQSEFEKMYPLNKGFTDVFIAYAEIKSFNSRTGRMLLENGKKYKILGPYLKEWRTTSEEIKARAKRSRAN